MAAELITASNTEPTLQSRTNTSSAMYSTDDQQLDSTNAAQQVHTLILLDTLGVCKCLALMTGLCGLAL